MCRALGAAVQSLRLKTETILQRSGVYRGSCQLLSKICYLAAEMQHPGKMFAICQQSADMLYPRLAAQAGDGASLGQGLLLHAAADRSTCTRHPEQL